LTVNSSSGTPYVLTANGTITVPAGKTLTKAGTGTFGLTDILLESVHYDAIIGDLVVTAGNVSMANDASINGTLTLNPSTKLVVNGSASVGSIVLASA
jgi:hypothetical protein